MPSLAGRIEYSEKYGDDKFEYRHVILPKELAKNLPKNRLLGETEWRGIGVQQSRGWQHYAATAPSRTFAFRRPLGTDPVSASMRSSSARPKARYQQQVAVNQQPPPKRAAHRGGLGVGRCCPQVSGARARARPPRHAVEFCCCSRAPRRVPLNVWCSPWWLRARADLVAHAP